MRFATITIWIVLLILLAMIAGAVALQIFLSRRESRWPGLVLPAIFFVHSLLAGGFGLGMPGWGMGLLALYQGMGVNSAGLWVTAGAAILLFNIPTVGMLGIYALCRRGLVHRRELERMRAQDLE